MVESMLARHAESPDFLESPALQAEAKAMARSLEDGRPHHTRGSSATDTGGSGTSPNPAPFNWPPWWMIFLAAVFVADCLLRSYCLFLGPNGFDFRFRPEGDRLVVYAVPSGSAGDRAGIKPGDILLALDGQPIRPGDRSWISSNLEAGRTYLLDIEREGRRHQTAYLMERVNLQDNRLYLWQINGILLLATALIIAFGRPYYFLARVGALALASLSLSLIRWGALVPVGYAAIWRKLPLVVGALLWIPIVCSYLVGPILLTFFALFPRSLFRARWPWAVIWLPALCFVPALFHSTFLIAYRPMQAYSTLMPAELLVFGARLYGLYGLASLGALAVNYFRLTDPNDRRRLRVLFVGGGLGVLPGAFRLLIWQFAPLLAVWTWLASGFVGNLLTLLFVLFPASFAYSILRHRLLDIRIIIRQGVQYAATRGALLSVIPVLGVILVTDLLVHGDQPLMGILEVRGWIYAALAAAAVAAHSQRRRWGEAIDRRFFRGQYDARRVLREVATEASRARSFADAAPGAVASIEAALHPDFAAVMQRSSGDAVFRTVTSTPADKAPPPLDAGSSLISILRILKDPVEVILGKSGWLERQLPVQEIDSLRQAGIDLLVPVSMTLEHSEALLALGAKRSEQPYTREDKDLLAAIAVNLGLLLERPEIPTARPREEFEECPQCGACYDTGSGRCAQGGAGLTPIHMPRTLAGRYHLERRLGRGGMGAVYEASDSALGRRVAVKVIREDRLYSAGAAQRFQREARAAAGFSHPNVVTIYDYGVEGGTRAFLVMELLEGATLREELKSCKRLSAARTVGIFRGVCSAVEAAHHHQLIHRDIKPENIFLVGDRDAGSETIKVLDFGIAKFLPGGEQGTAIPTIGETDTGILVGTPGYISPEQLLGEKPALSWDLWALAVTAYETLAGALPFPTSTWDHWRQAVLAGRYTPLSEHLADPPAPWQGFFSRALAADLTQRPQSAAEFVRHMGQALT